MTRKCLSQRVAGRSQSTDLVLYKQPENNGYPAAAKLSGTSVKYKYPSSQDFTGPAASARRPMSAEHCLRYPSNNGNLNRATDLSTDGTSITQDTPATLRNGSLIESKTFIFPKSTIVACEDGEHDTLLQLMSEYIEGQDNERHRVPEEQTNNKVQVAASSRSLQWKSPGRIKISPISVVSFHEDCFSVTSEQEPKTPEPQYAMGRTLSEVENIIAHSKTWKQQGKLSTVDAFSFLYGILLAVMGTAFPISQVISNLISSHYYEGFYAYLYFVSIIVFAYAYLLLNCKLTVDKLLPFTKKCVSSPETGAPKEQDEDEESQDARETAAKELKVTLEREINHVTYKNHGSFYLRIGAVIFGIGAMIFAALEFGQYFEMTSNPFCNDVMLAVQPFARMLFTFFQMYFIFLNSKLQIIKDSNVILARFGLMHLVATNYCVWLNAIVQETRHEINHFAAQEAHLNAADAHRSIENMLEAFVNDTAAVIASELLSHQQQHDTFATTSQSSEHRVLRRSLSDECQRKDLMGTLTQDASPFLFPCAIEYSLICAAITYEIWRQSGLFEQCGPDDTELSSLESLAINRTPHSPRTPDSARMGSAAGQRRSPHHYSVDCTKANKGLFIGIFVLVMTIVSMILFFVLINRDKYRDTAITEVYMSELTLYIMTFGAVLIGIVQVRKLHFDASRPLDLDTILLIIAMTGVIAYNVFTIVATQFSTHEDRMLILVNALMAVLQAIAQTMFVVDASKRHLYTRRQQKNKPGREVITFLMVTNFAMWAIITLEKSRVEAHPVQNQFFGLWPWAIISNVSSPLSIFYRYHSTVCLCEIWKRCYKVHDNKPMSPAFQQFLI